MEALCADGDDDVGYRESLSMEETFNAVEVFRIAEQIERDGAAFYRAASPKVDNAKIRDLLAQLADWELTHEQTFARMRQAIPAGNAEISVSDPEKCRAMAALSEFTIKGAKPHDPAGATSTRAVLEMALEMERDSIIFYTGLKDFVADPAAVEQIDQIIGEEHLHIQALRNRL
jgi:rubrerythrin